MKQRQLSATCTYMLSQPNAGILL